MFRSKNSDKTQNILSWVLNNRQICDLELLLNGGFAPLKGFMNIEDYKSVIHNMRLSNGALWPIPVVLDIDAAFASKLSIGDEIHLCNFENVPLASLKIESLWEADFELEANQVYGTSHPGHPGVNYLFQKSHPYYLGGNLTALEKFETLPFQDLRKTPDELKEEFLQDGWDKIIGFQTRNAIHRVHYEMTIRAMNEYEANVLIHPAIGETIPGDIDYYTRVQCYQSVLQYYPKERVKLSLLPLAMRMGGPKEALWHAIIRKTYGCNHFIVGRDHAGPGDRINGNPLYEEFGAQDLVRKYEDEIGIKMIPFKNLMYASNRKVYVSKDEALEDDVLHNISGTELRKMLERNEDIPPWYTFEEVASLLPWRNPPRVKQGICILFTGLPSSGKSTLAKALNNRLLERKDRHTSMLDGDTVRQYLFSELGYSKEDRDTNVLRVGYVASLLVKHCGIAICALISPYDEARKQVRQMVQSYGCFILIHVSTPLNICEERDHKGMYAKARSGKIEGFTGVKAPYEIPEDADIVIDTINSTPEESVEEIMTYLQNEGYLGDQS
ncbi:MAG: sulfate adenylyltransferase [Chlamydiales bacterium]|jgi:sulfate adenylyltransferase